MPTLSTPSPGIKLVTGYDMLQGAKWLFASNGTYVEMKRLALQRQKSTCLQMVLLVKW